MTASQAHSQRPGGVAPGWALVGPGAVGLYYGGLLARQGAALHVLARSDYAALTAQGLVIRMLEPCAAEPRAVYTVRPARVERDAARIGPVERVMIAAKATVNQALLPSLRALVEPGRTLLLSLQNGMGNAEFLAQHFPTNPVLAGLCFVCVNRTAPGVVENYHPGRVEVGSLGDAWPAAAADVVDALGAAGVRASVAPQLDAALWRKLCWNVPFNGLAIAAGGLTTDRIMQDAGLRARAQRLMHEIQAAARAAGHTISASFLQGQFDVTAKMGAYQPSSLIDYLHGRPVEIEAIFGQPLRRGQALGVALPELQQLYTELVALVGAR